MPKEVESSTDPAALREWIRFPIAPTSARWRLVRRASSGRNGILYFELHVLARFDGQWPAITAELASRAGAGSSSGGTQFWRELVPAAEMPMIEGPDNRRGTYYAATDMWMCKGWKVGSTSWVCTLAEPYVLGAWSSESIDF